MLYPYICRDCLHEWCVIKSVSEIDNPESCPLCASADCERTIAQNASFSRSAAGDWDSAQYCPVVKKVIKSNAERSKIAKAKGWEEVGNEDIHKATNSRVYEIEKQKEKELDNAGKESYQYLTTRRR